ncbi:hypothetical protein NDU88_007268 [Pleurodeles waltl]|uniref:Uncharacterized protein n=1 Tax=Pleurodeles waltl TaxID=8319 RepID=A0AAV7N1M1_PLEWA|nr:hypothetical protein NDU88_007268 [Pleurodeles waltl]
MVWLRRGKVPGSDFPPQWPKAGKRDYCAVRGSEIGSASAELGLLQNDHHKLAEKIKGVEAAIMDLQSEQQTLKLKMADLMVRVHTLEHRVEDVTGSDHRNNIRIVGLPEGLGGNGIVAYLEHWLHTKVALVQLIPFFAWERVHHVPAHPLAPGQPAQIG